MIRQFTIDGLAGLPASRWLFALRTWLAIHLALGVAFWVQLDGASSAGITVGIIALQTRGQIIEKAACFFSGTVVGGVMAIVIVGLFGQARDLYIVAYSAWLAVCVFAASFLDANRAYGAVLCGYTIAIVAVFHIDDPGSLFSDIVNRCAAIAIGIACAILLTDLFSSPDIGPGLLNRIDAGRAKVAAFADGLVRDGPKPDTDRHASALLRAASDQHPVLNALPTESMSGSARAGAVRAALSSLAGEIRAARALAFSRQARPGDARLRDLVRRRLTGEFLAHRQSAREALAAARSGRRLPHAPRMPIHRPWRNAARNALRAFLVSVTAGFLFVLAGWPQASTAWGFVGIIMCLSSNAPDPGAMSKAALIAMPVGVLLGGVIQFLLLSGVDSFPLLVIGTAPVLIPTLLLASSPNPAFAGIGLMTTVFSVVLTQPANPQSYDPNNYLSLGTFIVTAAIAVFVFVRLLFPTTDRQRRRWALASLRRDAQRALAGSESTRSEDEHRLLGASRIGTLLALKGPAAANADRDLATALRLDDLASAARRVRYGLDQVRAGHPAPPDDRLRTFDQQARAALSATDAARLRRVALALVNAADENLLALAADMAWAADLMDAPFPVEEAAR